MNHSHEKNKQTQLTNALILKQTHLLNNYEYILCKITFQVEAPLPSPSWTPVGPLDDSRLDGDNKLLAGLEIDALELWTALGEAPVEVTGKLLAAGHLDVGTGLDIDLTSLNVARHSGTNALRLVFLVGEHEASGQLIEAFAWLRCKYIYEKKNVNHNVNHLKRKLFICFEFSVVLLYCICLQFSLCCYIYAQGS